jgi:hypothetical protein
MSTDVREPSIAVAVGVAPASAPAPERVAVAPTAAPVVARKSWLLPGGYGLSVAGYGLTFVIPHVHSIIGQKCFVVLAIGMLVGGVSLILGSVVWEALRGPN